MEQKQRNFEDINIIRGVNYHLDNHGILESLLFTAGDEGLDEKQLLEILDMSKNQLVEVSIQKLFITWINDTTIWNDVCFND